MSPRAALLWIGAATLLGAGPRIAGLASDFWLDEVWTWAIAADLSGPGDVFTGIHHSNNHHLVTLWVLALGSAAPEWAYRLPSLLSGIAAIPLAAAIAWRRGPLEAAIAATGVAACFALVHFSSEARGYALAVAFALAAHLALSLDLEADSRRAGHVFAACVSLGLLAHLGFAFYWAGAAAHSLWQRRAAPPRDRIRRAARLHALPLLTLALLYASDLRAMQVGGGNPTDMAALAARTVGFGFGLPVLRSLALPYAVGALAVVGLALLRRARSGGPWITELVAIVVAPLLTFVWIQPDVIAVRYFLIGIALALLLCADLLAAGWRAGGARRGLAVAAGLCFLAGNAGHDRAFLEHGRGGFRAALDTMLAEDPVARVASDHDFRNGIVLRFHARDLSPPKQLVYLGREQLAAGALPPDWRILHRAQRPAHTPPLLRDAAGHRYTLVAEFDHAAISGFYWALYRNDRSSTTVPKP